MPSKFKSAVVTPLLKKQGLDLTFKNYRPVSNTAFLAKVIERAVSFHLVRHLSANNLWEPFQSAYREFHSTETALLRVQNDILWELDRQQVVVLLLLDLSAAFDTIDHNILLTRLSSLGVKGTSLQWFKCYLTGRSQAVRVGEATSRPHELAYGVPQGSVLGPILFSLYMLPLAQLIKKNKIQYHFYADDTQLYLSLSPEEDPSSALEQIEQCVSSIKGWMKNNKLKLNDDKTELLVFGTPQQLKKISFSSVVVGSTVVSKSSKARNLGVIFDENLNFNSQVNIMCKKSYFHLRNLSAIRKYLDQQSAKKAVQAFVTSTLDYGNSLLYGLPKNQLEKLQLVQNSAVRIIMGVRKFDHITHLRRELHWLPVADRISFKILVLTWKCLHDQAPNYLSSLVHEKSQKRRLRSSDQGLLATPRSKLVTCGDRTFSKAAPVLWNALSLKLRRIDTLDTFKSALKTHLFN